jgi:hypothetical protein
LTVSPVLGPSSAIKHGTSYPSAAEARKPNEEQPGSYGAPALLLLVLIHRSAWKVNSPKYEYPNRLAHRLPSVGYRLRIPRSGALSPTVPPTRLRPSRRPPRRGQRRDRKGRVLPRHAARRPPYCFSRYPQNCRTNPSSETILPSSPVYLATPSCQGAAPSPPRDASTTAARRFASASPWASAGMASSCSRCLRDALE